MPSFRKLGSSEARTLEESIRQGKRPSRRQLLREEYRGYLQQLRPGDWGEVRLGPGEKRNTVRARLHRAAEHLGLELEFKRSRGQLLHFEVR